MIPGLLKSEVSFLNSKIHHVRPRHLMVLAFPVELVEQKLNMNNSCVPGLDCVTHGIVVVPSYRRRRDVSGKLRTVPWVMWLLCGRARVTVQPV